MIFGDRTIKFFVYMLALFNFVDIIVSVRVIKYGTLKEDNPFMKLFLDMDGVMPFLFVKTFLICSGCYFLYKYRDKLMAQIGAYMCFCFYWALIVHFYYFLWIK